MGGGHGRLNVGFFQVSLCVLAVEVQIPPLGTSTQARAAGGLEMLPGWACGAGLLAQMKGQVAWGQGSPWPWGYLEQPGGGSSFLLGQSNVPRTLAMPSYLA